MTVPQSIRDAVRTVWRAPGFSAVVVVALATGIGASTASFALLSTLLYRAPAGVGHPDALVTVTSATNYVEYQDLARATRTLDVAAYTRQQFSLGLGATAELIPAECVTADYFPTLGTRAAIGRVFLPDENLPGAPLSAVLSHEFWTRAFGRDRGALGQAVTLGARRFHVIGIMPPRFRGIETGPVDVWIALAASPEMCSFTGTNLLWSDAARWLTTIGRVRDGFTVANVNAEIASLTPQDASPGRAAAPAVQPIVDVARRRSVSETRVSGWLVAGAGLLLLVAAANVAGLLGIRALDRRGEMSIRLQLGATKRRVFAQVLTEHLLIVAMATGGAALVAAALWALLQAFFPIDTNDPLFTPRSVLVLLGFAGTAAVLSGVGPAVQAGRASASPQQASRRLTQRGARLRMVLLVLQSAFAMMLVVAAGLFVRSVRNVRTDLGYQPDRVLVASLDLQRANIRREADVRRVFDAMLDRMQHLPEVERASLTSAPPLGTGTFSVVLPDEGSRRGRRRSLGRFVSYVSPDYFATLGTRIVQGRAFAPHDTADGVPTAIVDAGLAAEAWPGQNVVGQCVAMSPGTPCYTIVGISEPRRMESVSRVAGELFFPLMGADGRESMPQGLLVRPRASTRQAIGAIAREIRAAVADLPAVDVKRLDDLVDFQARGWRVGATIFGLFGAVAIALAALGIYASAALATRQKTPEIGVRLALGAGRAHVVMLVIRHALLPVVIGWLLGACAGAAAAQSYKRLLFNVVPSDPVTFAVASVTLGLAGLAGCVFPALRAARVDPSVALRQE